MQKLLKKSVSLRCKNKKRSTSKKSCTKKVKGLSCLKSSNNVRKGLNRAKPSQKSVKLEKNISELGFDLLEKNLKPVEKKRKGVSKGGSKKKSKKKERRHRGVSRRMSSFAKSVGKVGTKTANIGIKTTKRAVTATADMGSKIATGAFQGAKILADSILDTAPSAMNFVKGTISNTKNVISGKGKSSFKK